jgi:hypothetical protein
VSLEQVRVQALDQDSRGYRVAEEVYGEARPAERTLHAQTCELPGS